ncbi:hypothetical protein, partial [Pseudomonas syringae group genomosp. 7]|uniref:hypothetical protein n=1 Tax=Pseudomonas syringae group genomosp. 7 TaxID=251699 RepID=UPI0037704939
MFLIDFPAEASYEFLYSSLPRFLRFGDSPQAIALVVNDPSRAGLVAYSSVTAHLAAREQGEAELPQDALSAAVFSEFVASVIAL